METTGRVSPLYAFIPITAPLARLEFVKAAVVGFSHTIGTFGVVMMIGGNIPGRTKVLSAYVVDYVQASRWREASVIAGGMVMFADNLHFSAHRQTLCQEGHLIVLGLPPDILMRAAVLQTGPIHPSEGTMNKLAIATAAAAFALNSVHSAPLPEAAADEVGVSQQRLAKLDEFFAREIASKRVPGAVIAIARDGKLIHYKAYGQLDPVKGSPMRLDAIFALASMTKPMVAVAGLILMEEGRLPLHAKLTDYYPEFANMKVAVPQHKGH